MLCQQKKHIGCQLKCIVVGNYVTWRQLSDHFVYHMYVDTYSFVCFAPRVLVLLDLNVYLEKTALRNVTLFALVQYLVQLLTPTKNC